MIHDSGKLHAALEHETRRLAIGPSPLTEMMRVGAARRRRRRAAVASGTVVLVALPAAVMIGGWPSHGRGDVSPGHRLAPRPAPTSATSSATTAVPSSKEQPTRDQVVVVGGGTYQGRHWHLVRDRFIITEASDEGAKDLQTVEHLPFSDYGKPGTVACENRGIEFEDTTPVNPAALGGFCSPQSLNPDPFATPKQFQPPDYSNASDKGTGRPVTLQLYGYGPAAGTNGSTAVSATLTIDGVTSDKQPLLAVAGETTAYYAFVVPGTTDSHVKATVTFYDTHGKQVGTVETPSSSTPG